MPFQGRQAAILPDSNTAATLARIDTQRNQFALRLPVTTRLFPSLPLNPSKERSCQQNVKLSRLHPSETHSLRNSPGPEFMYPEQFECQNGPTNSLSSSFHRIYLDSCITLP